jgi:hypothetical protein
LSCWEARERIWKVGEAEVTGREIRQFVSNLTILCQLIVGGFEVCGVCYTIRILSMSSRGAAPDLGELDVSAMKILNHPLSSCALLIVFSSRCFKRYVCHSMDAVRNIFQPGIGSMLY